MAMIGVASVSLDKMTTNRTDILLTLQHTVLYKCDYYYYYYQIITILLPPLIVIIITN